MPDALADLSDWQHTALLSDRIVVLRADLDADPPQLTVTGPPGVDPEARVCEVLGRHVEVDVAGLLPREHVPLACVGHMEREPGRLQLRFVLHGDEHVDDIVVAEDDETVVVFATVCVSTAGPSDDDVVECPYHVYLDRPLGERAVIDAFRGVPVPYKNVWERIERELEEERESAQPRRGSNPRRGLSQRSRSSTLRRRP